MNQTEADFPTREELQNLKSATAERREVVMNYVAKGWGPKKIGTYLFTQMRHLVPSESLEQAINLVSKDIERIFADVDDADDALAKGKMAAKHLSLRLSRLFESALTNSEDAGKSEPFRASQAKLAAELAVKLAKLSGYDLDGKDPAGRARDRKETWDVQVGEGGVARHTQVEDEN